MAMIRSSMGKVIRRALSVRNPQPLRRCKHDGPAADSTSAARKFAKLSEAERAEVSRYLDQRDAEAERKVAQQVDLYLQHRVTSSEDAGICNRVLTFFGVPTGERRTTLLRRANLTGLFLVSWAIGDWQARTYLLKQGENGGNTDNAA